MPLGGGVLSKNNLDYEIQQILEQITGVIKLKILCSKNLKYIYPINENYHYPVNLQFMYYLKYTVVEL